MEELHDGIIHTDCMQFAMYVVYHCHTLL